jgi:hypothetical protein
MYLPLFIYLFKSLLSIAFNEISVHAFLTYSERDIHIALKTLTPILQKQNYILHVPDRDFVPGASKEENILKAIDTCRHTIFLLSGPYLEDEWSLFTFRSASEKSIRQRCNHMIVVVIDDHKVLFISMLQLFSMYPIFNIIF